MVIAADPGSVLTAHAVGRWESATATGPDGSGRVTPVVVTCVASAPRGSALADAVRESAEGSLAHVARFARALVPALSAAGVPAESLGVDADAALAPVEGGTLRLQSLDLHIVAQGPDLERDRVESAARDTVDEWLLFSPLLRPADVRIASVQVEAPREQTDELAASWELPPIAADPPISPPGDGAEAPGAELERESSAGAVAAALAEDGDSWVQSDPPPDVVAGSADPGPAADDSTPLEAAEPAVVPVPDASSAGGGESTPRRARPPVRVRAVALRVAGVTVATLATLVAWQAGVFTDAWSAADHAFGAVLAAAPSPTPPCVPSYVLGFASLRARLGDTMGEPLECEYVDLANGDALQHTSTGLAYYRRATNTPAFTDGYHHWALTSDGLVRWVGESADPPPGDATVRVPPLPTLPPRCDDASTDCGVDASGEAP